MNPDTESDKMVVQMYKRIVFLIIFSFTLGHLVAQQIPGVTARAIGSSDTGIGKVYYADRNEPPRAIEFKERTITASHFLGNINRYLNLPAEFTFIEAESNTDDIGMEHRLMQQYYKGIPLEGMAYRIHEKNGFVTSANGKAVRKINIDTNIILSEEQAFHLALFYLQTKDTSFREGTKLIVSKDFTFTPESFSVAFQFDVDVSLIERWRISIDARNGELLNKVSLVNNCFNEKGVMPPLPYGTGTGLTNYYGNKTIQVEKFENGSSRLTGRTENGGSIQTYDYKNASVLALLFGFYDLWHNFYSSDNTYNTPYQRPAVSVQWAAEQAYEYYFKEHNRNSFDNKGSAIKSYVHVDQDLNNAFWTGKVMAFGDGSNNNPLVELDVVSHELTHGITQYEAQLRYSYEPGALNESFSDILGKAVEFYTFGDTATWQLARHYRDGGLRDFSNPNLKNQPDTYAGDLWYTGYEDSGGVHYNSGVQNFWFYLLCEGGSGVNDHQVEYSINAIGMDKAVKIAYRNLTEYLGYSSDYLDSRIGSLLATADLYGKNSTAYQEVDKAWDAVGVIDEPIITNFELYDITATTVKIKGSMQPRSETATYHFEYGTSPDFGSSSPVYEYTNKVEGILTGLQSETKYYFRLVATNENGSTYSTTEFTTISPAPLVRLKQTVDVTENTATLYGEINPNSLPTSFYFEYGLTPAFGLETPSYPMPDTTEFLDISASIMDLQPRQTYYYRLVATNSFASVETGSASFFTAVKPVISSYTPTTAPIGAEVTIHGHNFNSAQGKNLVSFGATRGTVLSSSSTEIKVQVPAGASLGPISLLDSESGLTAESIQDFVPTFTGEFSKGSLQHRVGINDPHIYRALVQDMDGDNKPDIVTSHAGGFSVFQNVNQGGDITDESFVRNTFPRDYNSSDIYAVDLDGNGLKDIVIRYQNGLQIYPNLSVPGFVFFGVPVELPIGHFTNLIFNDFDQDGRIDIAGTSSSRVFKIIRNQNPTGSLSANNFEQRYEEVFPYYIYFLTAADLNNDGTPDLLVGAHYEDFLSILTNNSHPGAFAFSESIVQDSTRGRFVRYAASDLNQDGWKDIASLSRTPFEAYQTTNLAFLGNKGNSPDITIAKPVIVLSGNAESTIKSGDVDGDGKIDLLLGLNNRRFVFFKNKSVPDEPISGLSFENFEAYGLEVINAGLSGVESELTINDLNGDGRPEIIKTNSYNYGPRDGYLMEIWQNSQSNCLDASLISLDVSRTSATIVLPPNTTLDQYEIEYARAGAYNWLEVSSTTLHLSAGYSYQFRARAPCYLGFTEYHYINFTTHCVDINSFSITNIGINSVTVQASQLSSFEVACSPVGKDQWQPLPQYGTQILNLLPGTTYDLRYRGRCHTPAAFKYQQFTTLCPALSTLTITELFYNKAKANWTSNYAGNAILEYSADNIDWILIDESQTMFPLAPGKEYFVRGSLACTNMQSDFIYTSFTTPCPQVSMLSTDNIAPFSATINWVDESETNSYLLTYSMTVGGTLTTVETSSTTFDLDGLKPGTQYTVTVAPRCTMDENFTSIVFKTVCYVPFDLFVNAITHTTAELSWSDHFSGVPYFVKYSISGSNIWLTMETALSHILLEGLRPGTEYEARVHINCLSETAPYVSQTFQTNLYDETTFVPNPTDHEITIYPSKSLIGKQFSIHDHAGRQVAHGRIRDYTIDLSVFSAGIYILKIEGEKPVKIVKH